MFTLSLEQLALVTEAKVSPRAYRDVSPSTLSHPSQHVRESNTESGVSSSSTYTLREICSTSDSKPPKTLNTREKSRVGVGDDVQSPEGRLTRYQTWLTRRRVEDQTMNHENKDRDARDVNEDRTGHEAEASAACNDDDITLPYYVASNLNGFTSHHIDEYGGVGEIGNIPRNKSPFGKHHAKHMVSGLRHEYLRHRHLHEWRRSEEETHSDEEALLMPVNYSRISNAQVAEPSHTAHGSYALPRSRRTPADASFSAYLEKSYLETKMRFDMPEDEVHRLASNAATRTRIMPEVLRRRQQCDKCAIRKFLCDGLSPSCSPCIKRRQECSYPSSSGGDGNAEPLGETLPSVTNPASRVTKSNHSDEPPKLKCSPSSSKATSEEVSPSSETDKSSVLETCLEEKKTQIIGNIISDTMRELHKRFRSVAYAGSVTTKSSVNGSSAAESGTSSGFGDGKRKRSTASGERNAEDMDGEDDTGTNGRRDKGREIGMTESSKFACPYFKYDTHKYKNWKTCPGPGWNDVHRVKEHLYRAHRQPKFRCGRCWEPFKDEHTYLTHQRNPQPCPLREMEDVEGFDSTQECALRSRKRSNPCHSEPEKWRQVFRILFPHVPEDEVPSPFYEYLEHWQQQHLDQKSGEVDRLAQIEDYLLREVPKRLRQALTCELDHDLNVVEEDLRRKTRSLLKDVLNEVRRPNSRQERTMGATVLSSSGVPEPKATFHALSEDIGNGSGSTSGLLPHHMRPGLPPDEFDVDAFFTSLEEAETAQAGADQTTSAATEGSSFDLEPTYYPDPFHLLGNPELGLDGGGLIENLLQGRKTQKDSAYGSNESDDTKCI